MLCSLDITLVIPLMESCLRHKYDGEYLTSLMIYPNKDYSLDLVGFEGYENKYSEKMNKFLEQFDYSYFGFIEILFRYYNEKTSVPGVEYHIIEIKTARKIQKRVDQVDIFATLIEDLNQKTGFNFNIDSSSPRTNPQSKFACQLSMKTIIQPIGTVNPGQIENESEKNQSQNQNQDSEIEMMSGQIQSQQSLQQSIAQINSNNNNNLNVNVEKVTEHIEEEDDEDYSSSQKQSKKNKQQISSAINMSNFGDNNEEKPSDILSNRKSQSELLSNNEHPIELLQDEQSASKSEGEIADEQVQQVLKYQQYKKRSFYFKDAQHLYNSSSYQSTKPVIIKTTPNTANHVKKHRHTSYQSKDYDKHHQQKSIYQENKQLQELHKSRYQQASNDSASNLSKTNSQNINEQQVDLIVNQSGSKNSNPVLGVGLQQHNIDYYEAFKSNKSDVMSSKTSPTKIGTSNNIQVNQNVNDEIFNSNNSINIKDNTYVGEKSINNELISQFVKEESSNNNSSKLNKNNKSENSINGSQYQLNPQSHVQENTAQFIEKESLKNQPPKIEFSTTKECTKQISIENQQSIEKELFNNKKSLTGNSNKSLISQKSIQKDNIFVIQHQQSNLSQQMGNNSNQEIIINNNHGYMKGVSMESEHNQMRNKAESVNSNNSQNNNFNNNEIQGPVVSDHQITFQPGCNTSPYQGGGNNSYQNTSQKAVSYNEILNSQRSKETISRRQHTMKSSKSRQSRNFSSFFSKYSSRTKQFNESVYKSLSLDENKDDDQEQEEALQHQTSNINDKEKINSSDSKMRRNSGDSRDDEAYREQIANYIFSNQPNTWLQLYKQIMIAMLFILLILVVTTVVIMEKRFQFQRTSFELVEKGPILTEMHSNLLINAAKLQISIFSAWSPYFKEALKIQDIEQYMHVTQQQSLNHYLPNLRFMIDSTIYAEDSNHKYMAAIYKETVDYLGFSITKKNQIMQEHGKKWGIEQQNRKNLISYFLMNSIDYFYSFFSATTIEENLQQSNLLTLFYNFCYYVRSYHYIMNLCVSECFQISKETEQDLVILNSIIETIAVILILVIIPINALMQSSRQQIYNIMGTFEKEKLMKAIEHFNKLSVFDINNKDQHTQHSTTNAYKKMKRRQLSDVDMLPQFNQKLIFQSIFLIIMVSVYPIVNLLYTSDLLHQFEVNITEIGLFSDVRCNFATQLGLAYNRLSTLTTQQAAYYKEPEQIMKNMQEELIEQSKMNLNSLFNFQSQFRSGRNTIMDYQKIIQQSLQSNFCEAVLWNEALFTDLMKRNSQYWSQQGKQSFCKQIAKSSLTTQEILSKGLVFAYQKLQNYLSNFAAFLNINFEKSGDFEENFKQEFTKFQQENDIQMMEDLTILLNMSNQHLIDFLVYNKDYFFQLLPDIQYILLSQAILCIILLYFTISHRLLSNLHREYVDTKQILSLFTCNMIIQNSYAKSFFFNRIEKN